MKSSKASVRARYHKIPKIRFASRARLTSYAGLVSFLALFHRLAFKGRLRACYKHLKGQVIYDHGAVMMQLVVHLLIGFRGLRGRDYYHEDPLVQRVLGQRAIPDVATMSRRLSTMDEEGILQTRSLLRDMVIDRLQASRIERVTLDFDGSVQSTGGHAEGTAVGFNKSKKGARSYYPLFCTVAQTGQFFDMHHRPGNVHDSNGASAFMTDCFFEAKLELPTAALEARIDSAFFSEDILATIRGMGVEYSCSLPFRRFPEFKKHVENRKTWTKIDGDLSCFECRWKPKSWENNERVICVRRRRRVQLKGPLQLDLFEPISHTYEYSVIATNKVGDAGAVVLFHHGRGTQEKIFAEAKQHAALDLIPTKHLFGNQAFTLAGMLAHNLARELQMQSRVAERGILPKRPPLWRFKALGTLKQLILHKAGIFNEPQGKLEMTMNPNQAVRSEIEGYLNVTNVEVVAA